MSDAIDKISLQKLLLLFTKQQENPIYEFVPYKYGCYSFSVNADLAVMVRNGLLIENGTSFMKVDKADYVRQLNRLDTQLLRQIVTEYGKMNSDALMSMTYLKYPYYATRSETATRLLSEAEYEIVRSNIPKLGDTILFTIGYEGISLEEYLNKLLKNDIKILVDVRNNPLSRKYGFSKNQLHKYCAYVGVQYVHFPEVGIKSEQRQALNKQSDYDALFEIYRKENLLQTGTTQKKILELLEQHQRIALTCFEANIHKCHRKHLAEAIAQLPAFTYELKHI
jgi:uncharacterized protein (DUF488 family)